MERLQKVIAQAGICSRRKAEELILDGKVKVNGKVCDVLGTKVSNQDSIEVNGNMISKEEKVYYIMNNQKVVYVQVVMTRAEKPYWITCHKTKEFSL